MKFFLWIFKTLLISLLTIIVSGCNKNTPEVTSDSQSQTRECEEPSNPYSEGSGHYAGWAWAEEKSVSSCGGNSSSFIEGCEDYLSQELEYEKCRDEKN